MPTSLTFEVHLAAIQRAAARLIDRAATVWPDAKVPTCPAWDVRALVAHQAMVHRWATAHVTGADPAAAPAQTRLRERDDLPAYFRAGADLLVHALRNAPADLSAMTFLRDAPPPRAFWARRQAHETTVHMVDALAAALGRLPTAAEAQVPVDLAVDGVDELLCGFFTRGTSKLYDGRPATLVVSASDVDRRWVVRVAEQLTVAHERGRPGPEAHDDADAVLTGTAAQLYLRLWNRGDEGTVTGDTDLLTRWRKTQRVRWA